MATGPPGSIQLPSGRILVPADSIDPKGGSVSRAYLSDDGGATWALSNNTLPGGNEAQAAPLPWLSHDTVLLSARSAAGSTRLAALSTDGGSTWGAPWATIPETECEGSVVALPSHPGGPLLVHSSAFDASTRANMTLHVSRDGGHAWAPEVQVYPGPAAYSSLVAVTDSGVALAFERDGYDKVSVVPLLELK